MSDKKETQDRVSTRVDELIAEIERWMEQRGQGGNPFGFSAWVASYACIEAASKINETERRLGDPQAIAFGYPAQESELNRKSASYPEKWGNSLYMLLTVAVLIARDGRADEFADLYGQVKGGTPAVAHKAQQRLIKERAPYVRKAREIMKADIDHCDPFREGIPTDKEND